MGITGVTCFISHRPRDGWSAIRRVSDNGHRSAGADASTVSHDAVVQVMDTFVARPSARQGETGRGRLA
jgi:hypothetical protein